MHDIAQKQIFLFKLQELEPDPDLVVNYPDPAKRSGSGFGSATLLPGVFNARESRLPGDEYSGESQLHGGEYTRQCRPGSRLQIRITPRIFEKI
jgi:hypothetical protein